MQCFLFPTNILPYVVLHIYLCISFCCEASMNAMHQENVFPCSLEFRIIVLSWLVYCRQFYTTKYKVEKQQEKTKSERDGGRRCEHLITRYTFIQSTGYL